MEPLEVWGGLECTLNRVQERYINQTEKSGHLKRISDLEIFAKLGIKKLRYPCLWEQVAPKHPDHMDWSWLDERLEELRKLGINPIAGFLHHGSGPRYTNLIDPEFPKKLANYARAFVQRFPWIEDYTPINEINTTARFSCLYGHWYPHLKDDTSYLQALMLQTKATVLAMKEIRKINPKARLIQTDDLGKTQSTDCLEYQCEFENARRWISFDLLSGLVTEKHPLYSYFKSFGVSDEDLIWLEENKCPPDVIGINHYHLSNRYLDHRLELYPEWTHGGNGKQKYADVGAIDTGQVEPITAEYLMVEAWYRYKTPITITEVHTRGSRESQMRWLNQIWNQALIARDKGVNIQAITAWSLLGTYDWHNLCTKCEMFYESGVFDLRTPDHQPRLTGLGKLIQELTSKGFSDSPLLLDEGSWQTPRRMLFAVPHGAFTSLIKKSPPILITGANGTLGQAFARICGERNLSYKLARRSELDIADLQAIRKIVSQIKPWAIINAAGYVRVDQAEDERDLCFRENVFGPTNLAQVCAELNIPFVTFSSDLVFNGESNEAYRESHIKSPLNVYGKSKAECEEKVLHINPKALIIRTSSFFGPWDDYNFLTISLTKLLCQNHVSALSDVKVSPTYIPDLVHSTLDLLIDGEQGVIHLTNKGSTTWVEFLRKATNYSNKSHHYDLSLVKDVSLIDLSFKAKRPKNSVLESERFNILPSLDNALERYFAESQKIF